MDFRYNERKAIIFKKKKEERKKVSKLSVNFFFLKKTNCFDMVKRRTKNRTPNPVRSTRYALGGMGSVSVSVSLGMVDIEKEKKRMMRVKRKEGRQQSIHANRLKVLTHVTEKGRHRIHNKFVRTRKPVVLED